MANGTDNSFQPSANAGPPIPYANAPDTTASTVSDNSISPPAVQAAPDTSNLPASRPAPAPIQPAPVPPHRALGAQILRAVSDVLGGTPTKRFDPTTNTVVPNQLSTGQRVGNIVGAGLRGAAAGAAAHGPGHVGQAFLLGQQEEQNRQTIADKALHDQADFAINAINTARTGWQFAREKQVVHDNAIDKYSAIDQIIGEDPRNQNLGTFKTFADFLTAHPDMAAAGNDTTKLAAAGLLVNTIPSDDKGVAQGVHAWKIDPAWRDEARDEPYVMRMYQGDGNFKPQTINPGISNGKLVSFLQNNGYGSLGVPPSTGPKSHDEAVGWLANGSDQQRTSAQSYINTESKLKKSTASEDYLGKLESVPSELAGDKAAAAIPQLQNMLTTEQDPDRRIRINRLIPVAKAAQQGHLRDQQSEANAKQVAAQGDPAAAGQLLANGSLTLADLKTRGMTPQFIIQATNSAQRINPNYKPTDEVIAENVAKSPQANQFFGSANSLIQKGGTLDQLTAVGAKVPQNQFPALNTLEDWTKVARAKDRSQGTLQRFWVSPMITEKLWAPGKPATAPAIPLLPWSEQQQAQSSGQRPLTQFVTQL